MPFLLLIVSQSYSMFKGNIMKKLPKQEKRDQVIPVRVTASTKAKLDEFAASQGVPLALILQLWVQSKLRDVKEGYNIASELYVD